MFEADGLLALAGVILSVIFGHLPPAKRWYDSLDPEWKPLFMVVVLFAVAAGKLLIDCQLEWFCVEANWQAALWGWVQAVIVNQGTYLVAVRQMNQQQKARVRAILTRIEK